MAKATRKKKTVRASRRTTGMAAMPVKQDWIRCQQYVHYEVESREWGNTVKEYIKMHWPKEALVAINRLPDYKIGMNSSWATAAWLIMNDHVELVHESYIDGLPKRINALVEQGKLVQKEKKDEQAVVKTLHKPSIQERIYEQAQSYVEDIDIWLDGFVTNKKNFDPKGFDFKGHFLTKGVTQAHARKMRKFYQDELIDFEDLAKYPTPGKLKKMDEHTADQWLQLKEGYSHLKKGDIKNYTIAINELLAALDFIIESAKATRKPRKAKPKSADKLVEKLKYLKADEKYKVASINPAGIIGASELWVFNIKTRKLGKYIAQEHTTLQVKGTTLQFFDEKKSIQKTLRKPADQLREFKTAGKVALRKFIENIPTTDTKLNGRFNSDTIILKVI